LTIEYTESITINQATIKEIKMSSNSSTNTTDMNSTTSPDFNPSIYIPHVNANQTKLFVKDVLENKYNLGVVSKIECIPKVNQVDGHEYYSCFIFFERWGTGEHASYILNRLLHNEQTRLKHTGSQYWVICMNNSVVAFYENPVHMDLISYLHTDFTTETVLSVMEGLDLGKIEHIEFVRGSDDNYYGDNVIWNNVNKHMWTKNVPYHYNSVIVRFSFWYRTQTAYAFQSQLNENGFIDIPIFDGVTWTFYSQTPLFDGANPHVWCKEKDENQPTHIRFEA
jgi:hypothetical protein